MIKRLISGQVDIVRFFVIYDRSLPTTDIITCATNLIRYSHQNSHLQANFQGPIGSGPGPRNQLERGLAGRGSFQFFTGPNFWPGISNNVIYSHVINVTRGPSGPLMQITHPDILVLLFIYKKALNIRTSNKGYADQQEFSQLKPQ